MLVCAFKKIKQIHVVFKIRFLFSNFQNMDKVEKGPKEIFSPDIQKVRKHASLFIILL